MAHDHDQDVEQEVARGESERTPAFVIGGVALIIACLFAVAVAAAVIAYLLAR